MMTPLAVPATAPGSYGALELKQDYRKHMLAAVLIAAALHLCVVGGILLYRATVPVAVPTEPGIEIIFVEGEATLDPPPPLTYDDPVFQYARPLEELTAGIPVPWPDEEVLNDPHIPTNLEKAQISAALAHRSPFGDKSNVVVKTPVVDDWPKPTDFVPVEKEPVPIHSEPPVYPEMAALTGQSGTVWIQALVDAEGHVRKANVLRPSGSNVGFEKAAVDAAFASVYKPAIQNGHPVPVWITYRVDFKLR